MNVQEMIFQAQTRTEEIYLPQEWVGFLNAALDDLTPVAKMLHRIVIEDQEPDAQGNIIINIPGHPQLSRAHEILTVYYKSTNPVRKESKQKRVSIADEYSRGWKQTMDELRLQGITGSRRGDIILYVYKKLEHIEYQDDNGSMHPDTGNEIPELPEQYHQLIVMYMCSISQQKEEELEDKQDFYAEYLLGKRQMATERIWEMEPHNRKYIKEARIFAALGQEPPRRG